jgi:hypothetical protein
VNRFIRLLSIAAALIGVALVLGCTDAATAPSQPEFAVAIAKPPAFTRCPARPYAASSAWIGPRGGKLRAGGHELSVPAGALSTLTLITMEAPSGSIGRVTFGPEGLTFNPKYPAHLVMSYRDCSIQPGTEQEVAYVSDALKVLETQPSNNDPVTRTVDAKLTHFSDYVLLSTYAVAY